MYNITLIWDGNCVEVQDRYSNLARLYERLTHGLPPNDVPPFPPKLWIHTEAKMAIREGELERCLKYLFNNIKIQEPLEYAVSTGLSRIDFAHVVVFLRENP